VDSCASIASLPLNASRVLAIKSESTFCGTVCSTNALTGFTAAENPFLYPLDLLDVTSNRGVNADISSVSGRQSVASDADCPRWWLIHTKPRHEKTIARELRALDIAHYLPVTKCMSVTRGRPRMTRAPQFPGYLFLGGNSEQRLSALKTNRIVASHRVEDSAGLAGQLWDLADHIEKGVPLRIEQRLVAGQCVRVKSGLLKDKRGIVVRRAGKSRLFLLVNEILGGVSLEIEQHLLEPYW
jgi:transcription antitermination factor NusG